MDPQVEAAFDAWLASMGMSRNSPIPVGQEVQLLASWETFLLSWGRQQGRTVVAAPPAYSPGVYPGPPGGSFNGPSVANPGFAGMAGQTGARPAPGGATYPGGARVAPPTGGARVVSAPRYVPPPGR